MSDRDRLRARFSAAMDGADGALAAADLLCRACVDILGVDGASLSLMYAGTTRGTYGSSGPLSRRLDELQFTYGEGPCLDAVSQGFPVLVADLDDPGEDRWPALRDALLDAGFRAIFALPVTISSAQVGALDLFRHQPGPMSAEALAGGLLAADLAALPLMDLMATNVDWDDAAQGGTSGWEHLAPLERVEVYQATGMLIAALGVDAAEALIQLRVYAIMHTMTASEVAWAIVNRELSLDSADWRRGDDGNRGAKW